MVTAGVDRVAGFVEHGIMNVHGRLFLADDPLCLQIEEEEQTVVSAARSQQPITLGMEGQMLDKAIELVAWEFVRARSLPPIEHLDAGFAVQVVDVADLADTAHPQALAIRGEGQRADASDRIA